jgi:hypothetical protein
MTIESAINSHGFHECGISGCEYGTLSLLGRKHGGSEPGSLQLMSSVWPVGWYDLMPRNAGI